MSSIEQFHNDQVELGALINRFPKHETSSLLENLHWYGLSLNFLLDVKGLAHICEYNSQSKPQRDANARHFGLSTIFYRETEQVASTQSRSTVWHYAGLSAAPWALKIDAAETLLEKHSEEIIGEYASLKSMLGEGSLDALRSLGVFGQEHSDPRNQVDFDSPYFVDQGAWQGMYLYGVNGKNERLCALCPSTTDLVEQLPLNTHFGFVFFSDLLPASHIVGHYGSSNLRLRCHFGVHTPEPGDVQIQVGGESRSWRQGQCIFLDDSYWHEVSHHGHHLRSVLSLDLWHPALSPVEVEILSAPLFRSFGRIPLEV